MEDITCIINIYKRPDTLKIQFDSILEQTVKPKHIYIINNGNTDINLTEYKKNPIVTVFDISKNQGVWIRFFLVTVVVTKYVCIFDDDTIPGNRWLENCLNTIKIKNGLLGTIGILMKSSNNYDYYARVGWHQNHSNNITEVDIVGHSWFFEKDMIEHYLKEIPNISECFACGEDIHFSYCLQKYAPHLKVYVPPHPINDPSLWGSQHNYAMNYGTDKNAISQQKNSQEIFDAIYKKYRDKGLIVLSDK